MIERLHGQLLSLRQLNGSYVAAPGPHYREFAWLRDMTNQVAPELLFDHEKYKQTYHTILDYYIGIQKEYKKFYYFITSPQNKAGFEYPHPRITPDLKEIRKEWGFKQIDVFGEVLFGIYKGEEAGIKIIRGHEDSWIISLIIEFLEAARYWECPDNGIWEEYEEVHASSIGACLAGLTAIKMLGFKVKQELLDEAHYALNALLPRESVTKECDLALLTLIYPFNIIDAFRARTIINNVEKLLLRERGVIRYKGDMYYNLANHKDAIENDRYYDPNVTDPVGAEAEWCFGIPYLGLAHLTLGNYKEAEKYRKILLDKCIVENGKVPELFYSKTAIANDNTPLGWSNAMAILFLNEIKSSLK